MEYAAQVFILLQNVRLVLIMIKLVFIINLKFITLILLLDIELNKDSIICLGEMA